VMKRSKPATSSRKALVRRKRARLSGEWSTPFPFSTRPPGTVHLPIECVVYVPSTLYNKTISDRQFAKRIKKTAEELVSLFGGCRETIATGRYMDRRGELIEEKVAVLIGYGQGDRYLEKREMFLEWLLKKKKEWQQESIGFEFEGDLWYI
jgi:hypothetical protein